MTNIDKFKKLKQLYQLRCKLHKQNMIETIQLEPKSEEKAEKVLEVLGYVNLGLQVYQNYNDKLTTERVD